MNIFVSYTTRNNEVTKNLLNTISEKVSVFGKVFIDMLNNNSIDKQERVLEELKKTDLLILITSESTYKSDWVKLELQTAKRRHIPIVELQSSEIHYLTTSWIGKILFEATKHTALPPVE